MSFTTNWVITASGELLWAGAGYWTKEQAASLHRFTILETALSKAMSLNSGFYVDEEVRVWSIDGNGNFKNIVARIPGTTLRPRAPADASYANTAPTDDRLHCWSCGKSVSSPVPPNTIVRAYLECPECIERRAEQDALAHRVPHPHERR